MLRHLAVLAAALVLAGIAHASEKMTEHTLRAGEDTDRPRASIGEMAWLAGAWSGSGLGGESEELWSAPRYGVMVGAYRMIKDGRPVFYELLTLSEVERSLELKLKHFDAALRGWEEKNESQTFRLLHKRDGRFYFEGMTFEPRGQELIVYLAIEDRENKTVHEEVFRYTRLR